MNILHISPNFNYACGVSRNVYYVLKELSQKRNHKIFFITNGGDALEKLNQLDINVYRMKFNVGLFNLFHLRKNIYDLTRFCLTNKIDIVHTHHRYPELLAHIISKKLSIKTVTTVHSVVNGYKNLSFRSDRIIAVSKFTAKYLTTNFKVARDKIEILYNCISPFQKVSDDEIGTLRNRYGINKESKIFLYAGRITKSKGINLLINAFKKLQKKYDNITLILVGKDYEKYSKKIDCKKIIIVKQQANLSPYYFLSDFVVLPSKVENFPYIMLEAGLSKKLFIGSNIGGIAEVIEDGINGLLFNADDKNDLYKKMEYALLNQERISFCAENLFQKIFPLTDCFGYSEKLINIYSGLLNERDS